MLLGFNSIVIPLCNSKYLSKYWQFTNKDALQQFCPSHSPSTKSPDSVDWLEKSAQPHSTKMKSQHSHTLSIYTEHLWHDSLQWSPSLQVSSLISFICLIQEHQLMKFLLLPAYIIPLYPELDPSTVPTLLYPQVVVLDCLHLLIPATLFA